MKINILLYPSYTTIEQKDKKYKKYLFIFPREHQQQWWAMTSNAISSSLDQQQQGLIQQNSGIKYQQPQQQGPIRENSGIIVDREKQRSGPAQYKRFRFADDQIINSEQQERARWQIQDT